MSLKFYKKKVKSKPYNLKINISNNDKIPNFTKDTIIYANL